MTAGRISGTTGDRRVGSAAWARGEQGGVARVGDDVYAGQDGNVYKRDEGGGWEQQQPGGEAGRVSRIASSAGTLDAQQRARSAGAHRTRATTTPARAGTARATAAAAAMAAAAAAGARRRRRPAALTER